MKEQEVMKFPQNITFTSELQYKKYEDIIHRKIHTNRYMNRHALIEVGLIHEVSLLFQRVRWE